MSTLLNTLPLVAAAILTALVVTLALAGAVQVTSRREHGYVHLIFYAMLLTVAVGSLLSGRDMSTSAQLAASNSVSPAQNRARCQPSSGVLSSPAGGHKLRATAAHQLLAATTHSHQTEKPAAK